MGAGVASISGNQVRVKRVVAVAHAWSGTTRKIVTSAGQHVPSSFLLLVVRPGAPSSVLAPSSDARSP